MKARIAHALPTTNPGKLAKLDALQAAYSVYVQKCIDAMVANRRHHVTPSEFRAFFPQSDLSSQLQKCARSQASNIVTTWAKAIYPRLKRRIYEHPYASDMRSQLRIVGKCALTRAVKTGHVEITQAALDLWWGWVWAEKPPVVADDLPMWLSEMCVEFAPAKRASSHGGWWARVSCLDNGRRVTVPLAKTPYLVNPAQMVKSVLVGKRRGRWIFQFTDKTPDVEFEPTTRKVGVDVGLNVLAATSDGRLLGRDCKPRFDLLYRKTRSVRANRMRQGLKHNSPRLDRMEEHLSGMVKTDTGTVAHRLVTVHPDATFVIENLDLRGCRGQKRFAYRALHRALASRAPVQGVNPAYSSQTCPSCGYVSRKNRDGTNFRCRSCGRISHADVVGAINLLGRSEDKRVGGDEHYKSVGTLLRERYRRRRDSSSGRKRRAPTVAPDAYCESTCSHGVECGQEADCP